MKLQEAVRLLAAQGCPVPEVLVGSLRLLRVSPGQIVCLQSCPVERMMLLLSGELLIEAQFASGDSLVFSAENGLSVMGDMELLSGKLIYASTVRAKTDAILLTLPIASFQQWMALDASFRERVVQSLAEKCYRQSVQQGVTSYLPPTQRVARFLTEEALRNPMKDHSVRCSHAELARRTGMSERTANRALQTLRELGAIETTYGKITLNAEKLQEIAAE